MEPPVASVKKFFSEAARCGYYNRAFTILQGEDADMFIVCEKNLTDQSGGLRRWVGRGNRQLCELMASLLRGEEPYGLRVDCLVPNPREWPPFIPYL